mgnify:CR=1 FL=1
MAETKNLCAQIDLALHTKVCEERERAGQTTSQYITQLLREYYEMKENGGKSDMANSGNRTMAFQISEELFQRIKRHLERESLRTGRKLTQRDFVLGLIEQALAEAEASLAPQEAPESTEEAPEDSGAAGTTPDASEASTEAERDTADIEQ